MEAIFAGMLIVYWRKHGSVQQVFSHVLWDTYMMLKHWSEVVILALMLYILQSRFTTSNVSGGGGGSSSGTSSSNIGSHNHQNTHHKGDGTSGMAAMGGSSVSPLGGDDDGSRGIGSSPPRVFRSGRDGNGLYTAVPDSEPKMSAHMVV